MRERMERHRRTRRARAATRGWIRSASRWRTSTRSAAGARQRRQAADRRVGALPDGTPFRRPRGLRAHSARAAARTSSRRSTEKLLTYALGPRRRLPRSPGGPGNRPRRGAPTIPLVVDSFWVSSPARRFRCGDRGRNHDRHEDCRLPRRTVLRGLGATHRRCRSSTHGAGADRAGRSAAAAAAPFRACLRAERHGDGEWTPKTEGRASSSRRRSSRSSRSAIACWC